MKMRLKNITACAHPSGNQIRLTWIHPDPDAYPGVRVVRRSATHPTSPEPPTEREGTVVADIRIDSSEKVVLSASQDAFLFSAPERFKSELDVQSLSPILRQKFTDEGVPLADEVVVSVETPGVEWQIKDTLQCYLIKKSEQSLYVFGGLSSIVDQNLRGEIVYYYTLFPFKDNPPDFHFDRHNRTAAQATSNHNMAGQMYALLPRIYHRYDAATKGGKQEQTNLSHGLLQRFLEIPGSQLDLMHSYARASLDLYNLEKTDGRLLPLLGQWIGWQTDHNLEIEKQRNDIRNAPAIYETLGIIPTAEAFIKRIAGWESRTKEYIHNIFLTNRPERLNLWMCERNGNGPWKDDEEVFSLDFAYEGRPSAVKDGEGVLWLFYHTYKTNRWDLWFKYKLNGQEWSASQPFERRRVDDRSPTAAIQNGILWVFWEAYNLDHQMWQINYRTKNKGEWSKVQILPDASKERRSPWSVTDDQGGLWLFWLENDQSRWELKYNRHEGNQWNLDFPADFPANVDKYPGTGSEPFILYHPTAANQKIWVFWNQKIFNKELNKTHWAIAYRVKKSIDPGQADWGPVATLPGSDADDKDYHDRGLAAIVDNDGNIEAFWSSNRAGGWAIWQSKLNLATGKWTEAAQVVNSPFTCRDPMVISDNDRVRLIYRSSRSIAYTTKVYGATKTLDHRYAGSTTVDTRNRDKVDLIDTFKDFLAYTLHTGARADHQQRNLYFYNVVGFFIRPETGDTVSEVLHKKQNLLNSLSLFVPVNVHGNVIVEPEKQRVVSKEKFDFSEAIEDKH
jgi:hypothetical protein